MISDDAGASKGHESKTKNSDRYTLPLALPDQVSDVSNESTDAPTSAWREFKVKSGDSLAGIFTKAGLSATDLHNLLSQDRRVKKQLTRLIPGQTFKLNVSDEGRLNELVFQQNDTSYIKAKYDGGHYVFDYDQRDYDRRATYAKGIIKSSLFEAAKDAGLSENLTMDLAYIFGWDVDFVLDIREGDSFNVVYEELYLDGKKVADGNILAAEFVNQGRSIKAVRYETPRGYASYYTPEGRSMRKAFLRTPVDFTRISSRFGKRHHPILNTMRSHKGVDYAAPRGTPVKASGDGKIIWRGRKGGYGKTVVIDHGNGYSTLYAHMNSYSRKFRSGSRVKQGDVIGFVGSTGRATGPHLHYEFRVHGSHRNPLTVKLPTAAPVNKKYLADFQTETRSWLAQLDLISATSVAFLSL